MVYIVPNQIMTGVVINQNNLVVIKVVFVFISIDLIRIFLFSFMFLLYETRLKMKKFNFVEKKSDFY